ncbi:MULTISPECIES: DUF1850 domain-containing protein [Haloferax]|uniref:DUF1850 domain-containing protein n=2 Tax=Haloferax TaxID=2251 RepID=A0A6G1YZX0_9EURY|nr:MULTISPECIES: DUF1850 domain-containing protein [Haloferax]KAB1187175.1 DUF1850 domain-containing protein [Haloferax sp. CBA1149]MRW79813.1 DUF1850 domain-containing protein [Haloferax marinisediminis]
MLDSIYTRILVAVAVLALAVGGSAAVPAGQALVVEDAETGERLKTVAIEENSTVSIEYNHSVEKTRVLDEYTVRNGELEMTRMEFESYGWGLPARAEVHKENGSYVFDPEGSWEEIYVKPGYIAGHKLHVDDETYDLVALSDARSVRLRVTNQSVLDAALH